MFFSRVVDEINESDFLNDLYLFYRYFIASNYKNSVPAPHIKELSKKLMKLALHGDGKHRLAVSMPPRHAAEDNVPVFTFNRGWVNHGDLRVGDLVSSPFDEAVSVVRVLPKVDMDNCLVFSNDDEIICNDEHLWKLTDNTSKKTVLYQTIELYGLDLSKYHIQYQNNKIELINIYKTDKVYQGNCIELESLDGMYLVGKNKTPTHNSKSSMVTLAFPLWLLFQDPNVNIMIVTGSPKLAEKFGIQLREYVRNLGHYFNVYLSNVKQASTHIMFCDKNGKLYKGNIMLATSGGGITGQDADYLILDDPYTGNDEEFTPSALQKKIDWVNRVVEQRIEPHTKYCVLHTRWHALSDDCPVYTINKGWTTHGELEENDILYGDNYKETSIIKIHPKCLVDNILIFSNGDEITCNDQHLWRIINKKENTTRIITTKEIMKESLYYNEKPVFYVNEEVFLIDAYKTEPVTGNCITVDSDDGVYLVGEHFTPTHNSHDIIGYYKETEPELYEFVEFPAISDEGEALWKERYTLQELLKKKEIVGDRVFESVYQQKPIDTTSDFFNMHHLKFGKPEGFTEQSIVRAWDIASSDGLKGDFTAGVRMVRYDDYCVITDLVHGRFGNQTASILKGTAELDTPNVHIVIETGVAAAGELLYQDWKSQLQGFLVDRAQVSGRGSKADRATPFKNAVEDGKVFVDIENASVRQELLDELSGFPNLIHDDIVDACAHAFNYLFMSDKLGRKVNARMAVFKLW